MSQGKSKEIEDAPAGDYMLLRLKEGALIGVVALCMYLSLALFTYDQEDPGWSYLGGNEVATNLVGRSGAWLADVMLFVFGYLAFVFPLLLVYQAVVMLRRRSSESAIDWKIFGFRAVGFILTLVAGTGLAALHFYTIGMNLREGSGGILGNEIVALLEPSFSYVGATLILLASLLFALTVFLDISWLSVMDWTGKFVVTAAARSVHGPAAARP